MRIPKVVFAASIIGIATAGAGLMPPPRTPKQPVVDEYQGVKVTEIQPVVDEYQGVKVTDDYRWLENSGAPAVKQWSDAQNVRTREYLDALPHRAEIHSRIDRLFRSTSIYYTVVVKRGGRLFAYKSDPRLQQPMIVTLASADDVASER